MKNSLGYFEYMPPGEGSFGVYLQRLYDANQAFISVRIGRLLIRTPWFPFPRIHAEMGRFSGLAGALFAPFSGTIDPGIAHWSKSADPVFMSLAGGITTFVGPTIGAAVFLSLNSIISTVTQYWMLIFGVILILIVLAFPTGITGFLQEKLKRV